MIGSKDDPGLATWPKLLADQKRCGHPYFEFLRTASMSCGLYVLPAGAIDDQEPHTEDEVYHVVRGRAMIRVGTEDLPVEPGSIVFVPAGVDHRFHSIEQSMEVLVVFAPAEGSQSAP